MDRTRQSERYSDLPSSRRMYDLSLPSAWSLRDGFLATDMYETDTEYVIKAVLPGVSSEDLKITRLGDTLTLEGNVEPGTVDESRYLYRERSYGPFRRTIVLPEGAEEEVEATLEAGILSLRFAKPSRRVPRSITVKPAGESEEQ